MAQTCIRIRKLALYGHHGVFAEEQTLGGRYEVDAELYYDSSQAETHDDVTYALNYAHVIRSMEQEWHRVRIHLLETLASNITHTLFAEYPVLQTITLRIRKLHAPVSAAFEAIEIEQTTERTVHSL